MNGKQTFTDVAPLWMMVVIVGAIALLIGILWVFMTGNMPSGIRWGVFVGLVLLAPLMAFLGNNLSTHRKVSSDMVECQVVTGKNWGDSQIDVFKWNEVTGTGIAQQVIQNGKGGYTVYYFGVGANNKEIMLLRSGTKDFSELLSVATERTPHLPYYWVERKNTGNRQVLQEIGPYCKVARS